MEPTQEQIKLNSIVEEVIFGFDDEGNPNTKLKFKYWPAYLHILGGVDLEPGDRVRITIQKEVDRDVADSK